MSDEATTTTTVAEAKPKTVKPPADTPLSRAAEAFANQPLGPGRKTLQQLALGGEFANVDLRTKLFVNLRQKGYPETSEIMIDKPRKVKNEDGTTTIVNEPVAQKVIKYRWDPTTEQIGDPQKSLTGALQRQKYLAQEYEAVAGPDGGGFKVQELLQQEYGVWFVTDPNGVRPGYRYSVGMVDRPPAPPKPERVKKEKPPVELDAEGNPIKKSRAKKAKAEGSTDNQAATAAAKSDQVAVEEPD